MKDRKPRFDVTFDVLLEGEDGHLAASLINISETGVLLELEAAPSVNQQVAMTPLLSRVDAFDELKGRVVRVEPAAARFAVAIVFVDANPAEVERLCRYLEKERA